MSSAPRPAADDLRWAAVCRRDATADGAFVYGVLTTGVYCRPSCPSRQARQQNVRFFDTPADAERSGLRPCLRCRPDGPGPRARRVELVAEACRVISGADIVPSLAGLAGQLGVSRFHLHRVFREETGITPKAYADALRAERARGGIQDSSSVTDAIYAAGFESSSRFYSSSNERLGMTPTQLRSGAVGVEARFAVVDCSLGAVLVAASDRGVCAIEFGEPETLVRQFHDRFHLANLIGDDPRFEALVDSVVALVEDPAAGDPLLPLDIRVTAFRERCGRRFDGSLRAPLNMGAATSAGPATRRARSRAGRPDETLRH